MSAARQFALLVRMRATTARRWLVDDAFSLVVMTPIVVGGAALIFQPYLAAVADTMQSVARVVPVRLLPATVAVAFVAVLIARFASTVRDVFAVSPADGLVDGLPVHPAARYHEALVVRWARALPVALAALLLAGVAASEHGSGLAAAFRALPAVAGATLLLGIVEIAVALTLVRLGITSGLRLAAAALVGIAMAIAASATVMPASIVSALTAYFAGIYGFNAWKLEDRERAREALARARRSGAGFERLADRLLGPRVGAQLVRDLRLVRRGYSSTPYLALGVAATVPALAVWLARSYAFGPVAAARAVETATVVSAFALAAITHSLVRYERPRIWIDLTAGIMPLEFPAARIWLARIVSLPAVAFGAAAAAQAGIALGPGMAAELLWLWWATASLTAAFCYEMAERTSAGLVLAFIAAAGDALLVVFNTPSDVMWYFGPFLYVYVLSNIVPRAGLKAAARA